MKPTVPIEPDIIDLPPEPRGLETIALGPTDVAEKMERALNEPTPPGWEPSGSNRDLYLRLAEPMVRALVDCVNEQGAVIDPVEQIEHGQTTSRFASGGAVLHTFERAMDLLETTCRTMDHACRRLGAGEAKSPDFQMRELVTALWCLEPIVGAERAKGWRADLNRVIPEKHYWFVESEEKPIDTLHNWTVFAAGGEQMRQTAGIGGPEDALWGETFIEKYMPHQLDKFTADGLYRDPNDPMTYDFATRLQFSILLGYGYRGPLFDDINELLRRGGLAMLLYTAPDGCAPFGGRSSQFHFQEAVLAATCEVEARRFAGTHPQLAGAFKRQASLSAASTARWIEGFDPPHHIKNGCDRGQRHGLDRYALYSVYTLNTASNLGLAALFADESIAHQPCPAEYGGYTLHLAPAFHKVFASTRESQLAIDTAADFHYDATGLGRFTRRGAPIELGLSLPFTPTPSYRLPEDATPTQAMAIGPAWHDGEQWQPLAGLSETLEHELEVTAEQPERVALTIHWRDAAAGIAIDQACDLTAERLAITATRVAGGKAGAGLRLSVPLLVSDGAADSEIAIERGRTTVRYRDWILTVSYDPQWSAQCEAASIANRSGWYRPLWIESPGDTVEVTLSMAPAAGL